jgi:triacylglycerol lipase
MVVAWWQRWMVVSSLGLVVAWVVWSWPRDPVWAGVGVVVMLGGLGWGLALQFAVMAWVARRCGRPVPWAALPRAWAREWLHALRVFAWRQPWRSRRLPDTPATGALASGRPGVVLVHGHLCNRGFWTPWLHLLQARGCAFAAVDLEPVFGDIDRYAPLIEAAVQRVTGITGRPPLVLCHSMGGLAVRAWWKTWRRAEPASAQVVPRLQDRVSRIVTLGSPHQGTWLARWSWAENGRQMRPGSDWLRDLASDEPPAERALFTCWHSPLDNVVYPQGAALLPGAVEHRVLGAGHITLAFEPVVIEAVLEMLVEDDASGA